MATGGEGNDSLLRGSSEPGRRSTAARATTCSAARSGNDLLDGGPGDDSLGGGGENDTMIGGPGVDLFLGSSGNDTHVRATTTRRDTELNGGPDLDVAHIDVLDPTPLATETVIRPSESCDYDGVTRVAVAGDDADVDGDARRRGRRDLVGRRSRSRAARATTTNTDSISIDGARRHARDA